MAAPADLRPPESAWARNGSDERAHVRSIGDRIARGDRAARVECRARPGLERGWRGNARRGRWRELARGWRELARRLARARMLLRASRLLRFRCRPSLLVPIPLRLPLSGLCPAGGGRGLAAGLCPAAASAAVPDPGSVPVLVLLPDLSDLLPLRQGVCERLAPGRPANESASSGRGSSVTVAG